MRFALDIAVAIPGIAPKPLERRHRGDPGAPHSFTARLFCCFMIGHMDALISAAHRVLDGFPARFRGGRDWQLSPSIGASVLEA